MYFLEDTNGNVVRAVDFSGKKLTFVLRLDTKRVEAYEDLSVLDEQEIKYTVLETINRQDLEKSKSGAVQIDSHLKLVRDGGEILTNVRLPEDDPEKFALLLKRSSIVGGGLAALLLILGFFVHPDDAKKEELQVVQVMDRKDIEKSVPVPPAPEKVRPQPHVQKHIVRHRVALPKVVKRTVAPSQNSGVLGVLGSLKKSNQRGGLQLDQAQASAGIGRGGSQGSGGIQTAVYSKGLFAAPLGTGGKVNGAGGYGTKGKGGGRAGYGQVSLIGAGNSYFTPVESEAWVEGGLDKNEIAAVIKRHESEVVYCYEQGLQQKPRLSGRLSMKFMIGPRGTVTLAQVTNSSLNHIPVENCIRDRLKSWNFPQPQGGVTVKVTYPFILRRVSDAQGAGL
jgi:hypothetical protein